MPNGNPDFDVKELERFFGTIAADLESFAQRHNLRLKKYYHQSPCWEFLFRHPEGGVGMVQVQRVSEATVSILSDWWYDDFDAATRFTRSTSVGPIPVTLEVAVELEHALLEMLSWRFGDWHKHHQRYTNWQKTWTREQFEELTTEYPEPLP